MHAFDAKGNKLAVGDEVTIKAKVTKVTEGSQFVGLETVDPADKPAMKSTLTLRADSVHKS